VPQIAAATDGLAAALDAAAACYQAADRLPVEG
jgi:hypothetical protein